MKIFIFLNIFFDIGVPKVPKLPKMNDDVLRFFLEILRFFYEPITNFLWWVYNFPFFKGFFNFVLYGILYIIVVLEPFMIAFSLFFIISGKWKKESTLLDTIGISMFFIVLSLITFLVLKLFSLQEFWYQGYKIAAWCFFPLFIIYLIPGEGSTKR